MRHIIFIFSILLITILVSSAAFGQQAQTYESTIKSANEKFAAKDYISAKTYFEMALRLKAEDPYATKKLSETLSLIQKQNEQQEVFYGFLDQGDQLLKQGKTDEALTQYQKALAIFPEDKYVNAQVNKILEVKKKAAEKKQNFEKHLALGKQLLVDNKLEEALAQLNMALAIQPDDAETKTAIESTEASIALRNANEQKYQLLMNEATNLEKRKSYSQAVEKVQQALLIFPDKKEALDRAEMLAKQAKVQSDYENTIAAADQIYEQKNLDAARAKYEEALSIWPGQTYATDMIRRIDETLNNEERNRKQAIADALANAQSLFDAKAYTDAAAAYNQVLNLDPENEMASARVVELTLLIAAEQTAKQTREKFEMLVRNGDQAIAENKPAQALDLYEQALQLQPDDTGLTAKIASTRQNIADHKKEAARLAEYNQWIQQADAAFEKGEWETAKAAYLKALLLDTTQTHPTAQIQKIDQQIAAQQQADQLNASYLEEITHGDQYFTEANYEKAIEAYRKALTFKPGENHPTERIANATLLLTQKQKAQQLEAEFSSLLAQAESAEKAANLDKALELYTSAVELKPDEVFAKEKMNQLRQQLAANAAARQLEASYLAIINEAEQFAASQNLESALLKYQEALRLKPGEALPEKQIAALTQQLNDQKAAAARETAYNAAISQADAFFESGNFEQSIEKYKAALDLKPESQYPVEQIAQAGKRMSEIEAAAQKTLKINTLNSEGNQLLAENKLTEAAKKFAEVLMLEPANTHASEMKAVITQKLETLAREKETGYQNAMAEAEQNIAVKEYKKALSSLNAALGFKPEDAAATQRMKQVETIIEERLTALRTEYNKAVSEADRFYNSKNYDQAIEKYLFAEGVKPDESYPREMIKKIAAEMEQNKIRDLNTTPVLITANTTKRFEFEPVDITERRSNFIIVKARNTGEEAFPLLVNFGSKAGRNGGFVLPIPKNADLNDFIVKVGQQYKWFSEDNTWIEFLPENGSIEISLVQISKSSQ